MGIEIKNISKSFSAKVLTDINLSVDDHRIVVLMGKNGCGKSTLLNIVAGIENPDDGLVTINGKETSDILPSMVHQKFRDSLFPWWTARQNIEFASRYKQNETIGFDPEAVIESLCINNFEDRYPFELSGGEAQIVAIARAFVFGSDILLFDEPSSSLSFEMEQKFHALFLEYKRKRNATVLFISHDPREAAQIGDRIIIFGKSSTKIIDRMDVPRPSINNGFVDELSNKLQNS